MRLWQECTQNLRFENIDPCVDVTAEDLLRSGLVQEMRWTVDVDDNIADIYRVQFVHALAAACLQTATYIGG
jgi:hypothetical protein